MSVRAFVGLAKPKQGLKSTDYMRHLNEIPSKDAILVQIILFMARDILKKQENVFCNAINRIEKPLSIGV